MFGAREASWPLLRTDLGLTYAQVGLLLAAPNLVSAAAEPAIGLLGDRHRRVLVAGGGLAFAGALAAAAGAGGFWALLVAFAILSPASGAFVSLSQASLMDADPAGRERNMVRWTIAGGVGALAGPAALGGLALAGLGWRPLFLAFAVVSVVLALATLRAARGGDGRSAGGLRGAWRALRRRAVVRWLVLLEASDLLLDVLLGFLALYLVDEAGLARGHAALAVSAWVAAGLAGNLAVLRLLARVDGLRYLRLSAAAAVVLFAAFLLLPGALPKLAALVVLGAVTAGWYPVLKARLYRELPGAGGLVMTLGALFGPLGSIAPVAVGFAAGLVGLDVALWLLLAGPVALLVLVPGRR